MKNLHRLQLVVVGLGAAAGCGDNSHKVVAGAPWASNPVQVIDSTGTIHSVGAVSEQGCVEWGAEFCLRTEDQCAAEATDILLDAKGEVLATLCYPAAETVSVEQVDAQNGEEIAQNQNDAVLVLDGVADGSDVTGDVHVDANNVIVYGQGPLVSVVDGALDVDGNNTIVRGVRVTGDLVISKNNAVVAFTVVEGDVTVEGNGARLLGVDVLGSLTVHGNGTQLRGVNVAGEVVSGGKNTSCVDSSSFTDADASKSASADELHGSARLLKTQSVLKSMSM